MHGYHFAAADLNGARRLELPAIFFSFSAINSVERKKKDLVNDLLNS